MLSIDSISETNVKASVIKENLRRDDAKVDAKKEKSGIT